MFVFKAKGFGLSYMLREYLRAALLAQQGVVGQVARANPLTASAILITDPHHALPVQIERNGLRTLAQGSGN